MEGWQVWAIVLSVLAAIWFISWLNGRLSRLQEDARKYAEIKPEVDNLERREVELKTEMKKREEALNRNIVIKEKKLYQEIDRKEAQLIQRENAVNTKEIALEALVEEKTKGFPWLATAYNEYLELQDLRKSQTLKYKSHPALKAAAGIEPIIL